MFDRPWPSFFLQLINKLVITGLIVFLALVFTQLIQHYPKNHPVTFPTSDYPVELYSNQTQDDLTHLYQHAIQSASDSIILTIYSLTDPRIIHALKSKSDAGIPVYIVSDAETSAGLSQRIPKATLVRRSNQGLMHQKILIIDLKQIWLGSANLTPSSLTKHGNLVMGIENVDLAQALTERALSMDSENGYTPLLHRTVLTGPQTLELWVLPDDPQAVNRLIELIRSAQKSIKVAMFTWTRKDFTHELLMAAKKGVSVEVVIDRYSGKGASAEVVRILEQGGIPTYLSTGQKLLHHKFAYIDDCILINGSANWTYAAFQNNDDCFVVLNELNFEQKTMMNNLWGVIIQESQLPGTTIP